MNRIPSVMTFLSICVFATADAAPLQQSVTIAVNQVVVYGELDAGKAATAVRERFASSLRPCKLEGHGEKSPAVMKLSFLINERGVAVLAVVSDSIKTRRLAACISKRARATRFNKIYRGARGELQVALAPAPGAARSGPGGGGGPGAGKGGARGAKKSFEAPSLRLEAKGGFTTDELLSLISSDHWTTLKKCFPAGRFDTVRAHFEIRGGELGLLRLIQPFYSRAAKKHLCVRKAMEAWTFPTGKADTRVRLVFEPQEK